jgi:hypothetical protein
MEIPGGDRSRSGRRGDRRGRAGDEPRAGIEFGEQWYECPSPIPNPLWGDQGWPGGDSCGASRTRFPVRSTRGKAPDSAQPGRPHRVWSISMASPPRTREGSREDRALTSAQTASGGERSRSGTHQGRAGEAQRMGSQRMGSQRMGSRRMGSRRMGSGQEGSTPPRSGRGLPSGVRGGLFWSLSWGLPLLLLHLLPVWQPAASGEPLALRWVRKAGEHPLRSGLALGLILWAVARPVHDSRPPSRGSSDPSRAP